jgi:uncharacterized membrane protein YqjE
MVTSSLLLVCFIAFISVFILLSLMALTMRIIIFIFPQQTVPSDSAVTAAISAAVAQKYPDKKITKIEEQ